MPTPHLTLIQGGLALANQLRFEPGTIVQISNQRILGQPLRHGVVQADRADSQTACVVYNLDSHQIETVDFQHIVIVPEDNRKFWESFLETRLRKALLGQKCLYDEQVHFIMSVYRRDGEVMLGLRRDCGSFIDKEVPRRLGEVALIGKK